MLAEAGALVHQSGITFNWEINVGNILTVAAVLGGAWIASSKAFARLLHLETRMAHVEKGTDDLHGKVDDLAGILATLARYDEKILNLERRVDRTETKLDELSHGEGFIFPDPFAKRLKGPSQS